MKSRKKIVVAKDPKKEAVFKGLAAQLQAAGYFVRREKLKAGPGWKVISGACRAQDKNFIFIDPKLTQEDQILFLQAKIKEHNVPPIVPPEGEVPAVQAA